MYSSFYGKMNVITKTMHKKHLINDLIPLFQIYGHLNSGIEVGNIIIHKNKKKFFCFLNYLNILIKNKKLL